MALTWSVSRDQVLHTCERRYYFQYLANARINSRDPRMREIALLKKVKNVPMWQGDAFHQMAAQFLMAARRGENQTPGAVIRQMKDTLRRQWEYSSAHRYREDPRGIESNGGLALLEHEYEMAIDKDWNAVAESIEKLFLRFVQWATANGLDQRVRAAKRVWIEPETFGPNAPGFEVDGVKVLIKVDLALIGNDGKFEVYDWKTTVPWTGPTRQIDKAEFQVNVYQLWPHLSMAVPLRETEAHLVYLGSDPATVSTFRMDENRREYTLSFIRKSIGRAVYFADGHREEELRLEDLDYAAFSSACTMCPYKRLCQGELESWMS